jgi:HD-GYP domain-containing protein (c-di-GMP phosphodiesterase class II)
MAIKSQKVSVYSLSIGMYVYKLDRPWAETSYPLEGFYIRTHDQIRKLKLACRYVFIDTEKTFVETSTNLPALINQQPLLKKAQTNLVKLANQQHYDNVVPLKKVMRKAIKNHIQLHQTIDRLFKQLNNRNKLSINTLKPIISDTVDNIIANPEALMWLVRVKQHDDYSYNFVLKQTIWALATARHIGMCKKDMENLALAGILSVVGKSILPKYLLENEMQLQGRDFLLYKKHIGFSVNILKKMKQIPDQVIDIIKKHCEYIDGSGYPEQLKGKQMPITAQVLSMAQFYENYTSPRDLNYALSPNAVIDELNHHKGKKFSAQLIEQFIKAIGIYPVGTLVQLSSGDIAVIIESSDKNTIHCRLQPDVIIIRNTMNENPRHPVIIHLSEPDNELTIVQSLAMGSYGINLSEINNIIAKSSSGWGLKKVIGF